METNQPIQNSTPQTLNTQPLPQQPISKKKVTYWFLIGLIVLLSGTTGVFVYKYYGLKQQLVNSGNQLSLEIPEVASKLKEVVMLSSFYPFSFKFDIPESWTIKSNETGFQEVEHQYEGNLNFYVVPTYGNEQKNELIDKMETNSQGVNYLLRKNKVIGVNREFVELLFFSKNTKLFYYQFRGLPKSEEEEKYFKVRFQEIADSLEELDKTDSQVSFETFPVGGVNFRRPSFMIQNPIDDDNYIFIGNSLGKNTPTSLSEIKDFAQLSTHDYYLYCKDPTIQRKSEECIEGAQPVYGLKVTFVGNLQGADLNQVAANDLGTIFKKSGWNTSRIPEDLTEDKFRGNNIVAQFPRIGRHVFFYYETDSKVFRIDAVYDNNSTMDYILSVLP